MRFIIASLVLSAALAACSPAARAGSIVDTPHNLSSAGTSAIRAVGEEEICVFCHTPHAARGVGVLWNRVDSEAIYETYASSTARASIGQPTGISQLCLSCHDGTVALGALYNAESEIPFVGGIRFLDPEHGGLEISLADDHPVSFLFDELLATQNGELVSPGTLPNERLLDANGEVQCSSCHDAHSNDLGSFLRYSAQGSELCVLCHAKHGWEEGTHNLSTAEVPPGVGGIGPDEPPESVASRGCRACHDNHAAGGAIRLRRFFQEEENCFPCHDGTVAGFDLEAEFAKISHHPVSGASGVHDPMETTDDREWHVECEDCHNSHAANGAPGGQGTVPGALAMVRGIDLAGDPVFPAVEIYQICMKCHGPNPMDVTRLPRQIEEPNILREIDPTNPSFHPIAAPGRNPKVPSLLPPWDEGSILTCGDCHDNDEGPGGGGNGPRGVHGSDYPPLLERRYSTEDYQPESEQAYELCFKCHDYQSIMADESFKEHKEHLEEDAPCSACHDPHGVSSVAGGTEQNNSHLINFETSIVSPNADGELRFEDLGDFTGRCYLNCHDEEHDPETYGETDDQD